jgi:hypothetical protein
MSQAQRAIIIPVTLALILLTAVMGAFLGTASPHEWDMLVARIQGESIISVTPASKTHATLYMLQADTPATREVRVDLQLSGKGHDDGSTSVPMLLTPDMGAVEIPLDDGVALRIEFVPAAPYADDEPHPIPVMSPVQVAER